MSIQRSTLVRLVVDIALIAAVGLAVLLLTLLGQPVLRGFYCSDETIKYPARPHTVSTLGVGLGALFIPIALMAVIEGTSARACAPIATLSLWRKSPPRGVVRWLRLTGVFLFGAGAAQVIVDVAKFAVGRLRPHFLAVCQLDSSTAARCASGVATPAYVTDYRCQGAPKDVEEARLSFPSGHASLAFYGAVFSIMYLQCTASRRFSTYLRHAAQLMFLVAAWFTALSRVSDYHHHWSDVLAGMAIGSLLAVLTVLFLSDLRQQRALLDRKQDETENLALMVSCDTNSNTVTAAATTTTTTYVRQDAGEPTGGGGGGGV